jgi:hypothetical protein
MDSAPNMLALEDVNFDDKYLRSGFRAYGEGPLESGEVHHALSDLP